MYYETTSVYIKQEPLESNADYRFTYEETEQFHDQVSDPISTEFVSVLIKEEDTCLNQLKDEPDYVGLTTKNPVDKSYKCIMCDKRYTKKKYLREHILLHNSNLHKCRKRFPTKAVRTNHKCNKMIAAATTKKCVNKSYECEICHKWFAGQTSFIRHKYTHTGERPFICDICCKTFTQPSALRNHLRMHTGTKPFKCDVCYKRFIQKCDLVRHTRSHTGEKPYECDICHMRFTQNCNLTSHLRSHTGEKYECSICHKYFSETSLRAHKLTHVVEDPIERLNAFNKKFEHDSSLTEHIRAQWRGVMEKM